MTNIPIDNEVRSAQLIDVAIVEDDEGIRKAYEGLIRLAPDMRCAGSFRTCEDAITHFDTQKPDVLLMDIGLPGMSGIEGTRRIKARWPSIEILMQTVYDDDGRIFDSICAGASGYVLKNAEPGQLIEAIREISQGAPMSPEIARRVLRLMRDSRTSAEEPVPGGSSPASLSPRELDILQSLVEGLSYKRIAEKHFISVHTVHGHIKKIYEKLQVHSKSAAVSKALRDGIF
jgi:DNA-binding NarL/FixJ family response regulator